MNHRRTVGLCCSIVALLGGCSTGESSVGSGSDSGVDSSAGSRGDSGIDSSANSGGDSGIDSSAGSGGDSGDAGSGTDSGVDSPFDAGNEAAIGDAARVDASDSATDSGAVAPPCATGGPDSGTDIVVDPGFENGGAGWSAVGGGATFGVTDTEAHCGTFSGEVSGRTQFYQGLAYDIPDTTTTAVLYDVSAWVLQDGAGNLKISVQGSGICGDAGRSYFNVDFPILSPATWTQATGTLTVPAHCVQVYLQIVQNADLVEDAGPLYPDLFADDVYVTQ
jgi:hypothetical protein